MDIVIEHGDVPSQDKIHCERDDTPCAATGNQGIYIGLANGIYIKFEDEEDGLIVGKAICRRLGFDLDRSQAAMQATWNYLSPVYFNCPKGTEPPELMRSLIGQLHHELGMPDTSPGYKEACDWRKANL